MPVIEESLQMSYVGGGNGTSANPYTKVEFDSMLSNDNWNGGYVEGMGYVAPNTYIYGNSVYWGSVSQDYYTFPDYVTSLSSDGLNQMAESLAGAIPGVGSYTAYLSQELGDMSREIQSELLKKDIMVLLHSQLFVRIWEVLLNFLYITRIMENL